MRAFLLSLLSGLVLVACGSGDPPGTLPLGVPPLANPGNVGGGGPGLPAGGGAGGGAPVPAPRVVFDDSAIDLGRAGAFPSDLVMSSAGDLCTVDDATIPANVVLLRADGSKATVPIAAQDLIDHDGSRPARAATTFGSGLFGAFTGDLELAFDRWLLVTVGAGNSVSSDARGPLRLANLVVVDLERGRVVQTLNLAWTLRGQARLSNGTSLDGVPQSLPVMAAFVPSPNGTPTGKVHVAMSNGAGTTAGLTLFFPGTVQEWNADFTKAEPLSPVTAGTDLLQPTRAYVSPSYNPVGLTPCRGGNGVDYLILTMAGASRFDANFVVHPVTETVLEFLDLDLERWQDAYAIRLGPVLAAPQRIALGRDANGVRFGLLGSQTYAAAFVVDLSGLDTNPVATGLLRPLRTIDLAPGGSSTAGSDFLPGVGVSASGRTAVLSSFATAGLRVLALPADIEFGTVAVDPSPFDPARLRSAEALGLGALVLPANAVADAYVVVNGSFDANFAPKRNGFVGTLTARDGLP